MDWTTEQKLAALMRLPWSVTVAPNVEEGYLVARVAELPSAVATGEDERALGRDLWAAIEASLACYLEFGDPIPLPAGAALPWEGPQVPAARIVPLHLRGAAWEATASTAVGRLIEVA
jgi:predicted RNase H-like HicB family nuclease